jgi:magnesium transporter
MECVIYSDAGAKEVTGDLSAMLAALADLDDSSGGEYGWLALDAPAVAHLETVAESLGLPALAVEDAEHAHQRAKLETYGQQLFLVLKTLTYLDETSAIETGEVDVFVKDRVVVTVRHGDPDPVAEGRARLVREPELFGYGVGAVVYVLADAVVDTYTRIVREVRTDVTQLEMRVFSPERIDVTEEIYTLKREVLEFREAVSPLVPVARRLIGNSGRRAEHDVPAADSTATALAGLDAPHFRDVADHLLRVETAVAGFDDLLNSILSAHLARTGMWQNEDMRKISAYAAIIAVPTLVAGVYGMNFEHMPELHWVFGYPLAVALMLGAAAGLFVVFRRNHWL